MDPKNAMMMGWITTSLQVNDRRDIVGVMLLPFSEDSPSAEDIKLLTLPGRNWEVTSAFTGLTDDIYNAHRTETEEAFVRGVSELLYGRWAVSFAKGIADISMAIYAQSVPLVGIPNLYQRVSSSSSNWSGIDDTNTMEDMVGWINSARIGRLGRGTIAYTLREDLSGYYDITKMGVACLDNLILDRCMFNALLNKRVC